MADEDEKYYQLFLMVILYDLPMCLMLFAYTTISVRLWKDTFSGPTEDVRTRSGTIRIDKDRQICSDGHCFGIT